MLLVLECRSPRVYYYGEGPQPFVQPPPVYRVPTMAQQPVIGTKNEESPVHGEKEGGYGVGGDSSFGITGPDESFGYFMGRDGVFIIGPTNKTCRATFKLPGDAKKSEIELNYVKRVLINGPGGTKHDAFLYKYEFGNQDLYLAFGSAKVQGTNHYAVFYGYQQNNMTRFGTLAWRY